MYVCMLVCMFYLHAHIYTCIHIRNWIGLHAYLHGYLSTHVWLVPKYKQPSERACWTSRNHQGFLKPVEYSHTLRVCNAYAGDESFSVEIGGINSMMGAPIKYKAIFGLSFVRSFSLEQHH